VRIWRADLVDIGGFEQTYETGGGNETTAWYDHPFTFVGDEIWTTRLSSDDDGRSWAEITTWRP